MDAPIKITLVCCDKISETCPVADCFDGKYNHQRCIHMKNMAGYASDLGLEVVGVD